MNGTPDCTGVPAPQYVADHLDDIIAYEQGELSDEKTLALFATLIRTGRAWSLQGFYGRAAQQLIDQGLISPEGDIL